MNKLLMTRTLVSSIRANFSTTTRRNGLFKTVKELAAGQEKLQTLPNEIHVKTGMDRATFTISMVSIAVAFAWGVNRCIFLAYKK